jgi:hypothetical protein
MAGETEYDVEKLQRDLMTLLEAAGNRADLYPAQLAQQFPHILARIVELWGKPELDGYFQNDLLTTTRPNRQGFPPEVAVELFRLSNHHAGLGLSASAGGGAWDWAADAAYFKKSGR